MGSLVEKKRNKMVMEMMFWFVVVVGMEEYMEGRMVEFSVGKNGESGQPRRAWLLFSVACAGCK